MTATATIAATERQGVLLVPNAALRFTPSATATTGDSSGILSKLMPRPPSASTPKRAGNSVVREGSQRPLWLLQNGQPVQRTVTTGLSNGRLTEVSGEGLAAGQQAIVGQSSAAP